jgi:hypothetical protein
VIALCWTKAFRLGFSAGRPQVGEVKDRDSTQGEIARSAANSDAQVIRTDRGEVQVKFGADLPAAASRVVFPLLQKMLRVVQNEILPGLERLREKACRISSRRHIKTSPSFSRRLVALLTSILAAI